jgi:hypothetical protein
MWTWERWCHEFNHKYSIMKQVKRILIVVFMLLGCVAIQATDDLITQQITIKLDEAGTLPDKIGSTKMYKITNLKIIGEINGTDLRLIRDMAGCDYSGESTSGKLATLDLSEVEIVPGGDYYYIKNNNKWYTSYNVLGHYAFYGCSSLVSVVMSSGVTSIGSCAFENCNSLTSVDIPSSVTSIGSYTFYECSRLTSVVIPSSVTSIGNYAFYGCSGLASLYVSWETPISITTYVFDDVDKQKCTLYIPQGTYQYYWLTNWGDFENIMEYDATGVDNVSTSADIKELARYSLNGQRLTTPTGGLNIVKYSDGSVKKVVVQ